MWEERSKSLRSAPPPSPPLLSPSSGVWRVFLERHAMAPMVESAVGAKNATPRPVQRMLKYYKC